MKIKKESRLLVIGFDGKLYVTLVYRRNFWKN